MAIKNFIQKRRAKKHDKRMTVVRDDCKEKVNVERQTMLCPHESIEEFMAGSRIKNNKK